MTEEHQHEWIEETKYYGEQYGETYKVYRCACGEIGYPVYDG